MAFKGRSPNLPYPTLHSLSPKHGWMTHLGQVRQLQVGAAPSRVCPRLWQQQHWHWAGSQVAVCCHDWPAKPFAFVPVTSRERGHLQPPRSASRGGSSDGAGTLQLLHLISHFLDGHIAPHPIPLPLLPPKEGGGAHLQTSQPSRAACLVLSSPPTPICYKSPWSPGRWMPPPQKKRMPRAFPLLHCSRGARQL